MFRVLPLVSVDKLSSEKFSLAKKISVITFSPLLKKISIEVLSNKILNFPCVKVFESGALVTFSANLSLKLVFPGFSTVYEK